VIHGAIKERARGQISTAGVLHIYIYIYRERERETAQKAGVEELARRSMAQLKSVHEDKLSLQVCYMYICMYVYTYMCVCICIYG